MMDRLHDRQHTYPLRDSVWFDVVVAVAILLATCLLGVTTLR